MVLVLIQRRFIVHSITDLNTHSNTVLPFIDERPTRVIYSNVGATFITSVYEGTHPPAQIGIDISDIVNINATPITYTIDMHLNGTIVPTWSNISANVSKTITSNVYVISNITTMEEWDNVKKPTLIAPIDYNGTYVYTSNVKYAGNTLASWGSTVAVEDMPEMTDALEYVYVIGTPIIIPNTPQIVDVDNTSYTLDVTVSNLNAAGNLSMNGNTWTTSTLTFSGNASILNSKLSNIYYYNSNVVNKDWYIDYRLTNGQSGILTTKRQRMINNQSAYIVRGFDDFHTGNISHKVLNSPTIGGTVYGADYSLTISGITANTAANISVTFNGTTLTSTTTAYIPSLTITGNSAVVNGYLSNLRVTSYNAVTSNFFLNYEFTVPTITDHVIKQQQLYYNEYSLSSPTDNIAMVRVFTQNTIDIFDAGTPIAINNPVGAEYTIILSSSYGEFGLTDTDIPLRGTLPALTYAEQSAHASLYWKNPVLQYTYTGSHLECNAMLATIKFYPIVNLEGNSNYRFRLYKNDYTSGSLITTLEQDATLPLYGEYRTTPIPDQNTYTFTSTSYFQPTMYQARYLKMDLLLVGAGGYDAFMASNTKSGAGGGDVREWLNKSPPFNFDPYASPNSDGYYGYPYPGHAGNSYLSKTHYLMEYPFYYHGSATDGWQRSCSIYMHPTKSYQVQVGVMTPNDQTWDSTSNPYHTHWSRFLDANATGGTDNGYGYSTSIAGFTPSTELNQFGTALAGIATDPTLGLRPDATITNNYDTRWVTMSGWRAPLASPATNSGGSGANGSGTHNLNAPANGGNGKVSTITGTIHGCGQPSRYLGVEGTRPTGSDYGRGGVGIGLVVIRFHE